MFSCSLLRKTVIAMRKYRDAYVLFIHLSGGVGLAGWVRAGWFGRGAGVCVPRVIACWPGGGASRGFQA